MTYQFILTFQHLANIVLKMLPAYITSAAYIQGHSSKLFNHTMMETNTMDPDQTAPDIGPYCLQFWFQSDQMAIFMNGRRRVNKLSCKYYGTFWLL